MPAAADGARRPEHSANDLNGKEARGKVPTDATHANGNGADGAIVTKCQLPHGATIEIQNVFKNLRRCTQSKACQFEGKGAYTTKLFCE